MKVCSRCGGKYYSKDLCRYHYGVQDRSKRYGDRSPKIVGYWATCVCCGELYKITKYFIGKLTTCGKKECNHNYLISVPNSGRYVDSGKSVRSICRQCGLEFFQYKTTLKRGYGFYCSTKCYADSMRLYDEKQKTIKKRIEYRIRWAIRRSGGIKKDTLTNLIGCDVITYMKYLENKFKPGMTWDNYGFYTWHIDHIIPVSRFDLKIKSEQKKAFYYKNTQPMWMRDNIRKGANILPSNY